MSNTSLPVISIEPYVSEKATDAERRQVARALHEACRDFGFFYLDVRSFVNPSEMEELIRLARVFFALPQEEKDSISITKQDLARGYQRLKENVTGGKADNHEAIDWYRPVENPDKTKPLWGTNQWPLESSVPGFREKYEGWIVKMKELGVIVMNAMADGLGLMNEEWEHLKGQVNDSFWVFRMIGYPPLPKDDDGFSCGAHKDYGCLTFLFADETKSALQVWHHGASPDSSTFNPTSAQSEEPAEKGAWIMADPIPGCFVCNIGEMWEVWTAGLYKSTLHRVIHRGRNYRVSIPFFFEANFDADVRPIQSVLDLIRKEHNATDADIEALKKKHPSQIYGEFLLKKVAGNFTVGKGKYDD
jgi:isopenicillin N synthase-like dioxygenase